MVALPQRKMALTTSGRGALSKTPGHNPTGHRDRRSQETGRTSPVACSYSTICALARRVFVHESPSLGNWAGREGEAAGAAKQVVPRHRPECGAGGAQRRPIF